MTVDSGRRAGSGLIMPRRTLLKGSAALGLSGLVSAPFIIMRNTVRGRRIEHRRFEFVMLATVLAGFWSMMSGTFVLMLLETTGVIA